MLMPRGHIDPIDIDFLSQGARDLRQIAKSEAQPGELEAFVFNWFGLP